MLEKHSQEFSEFERILSPHLSWQFVLSSIVVIAINVVSNALSSISVIIASIISATTLIAFFCVWWFSDRRRMKRRYKQLEFAVSKEPPSPAKGLILLISPYDPRKRDIMNLKEMIDDIINKKPIENLEDKDFESINLLNSNLQPQIEAVKFHAKQNTLRDVWLITAETIDSTKGSEEAGAILEKYLQLKYGRQITIHRDGLCVNPWDYAGLCQKAEEVFRRSGYKEEVLLADITGGTKLMSVALAMACIPPGRKMQYMSSDRDWQGNPIMGGSLAPLVIDVDPIIHP